MKTETQTDAFKIGGESGDGKRIFLSARDGEPQITIDADDVDTYSMAYGLRKLIAILIDQWDKPEWAHLNAPAVPSEFTNEEEEEESWEARYKEGKALLREIIEKGK